MVLFTTLEDTRDRPDLMGQPDPQEFQDLPDGQDIRDPLEGVPEILDRPDLPELPDGPDPLDQQEEARLDPPDRQDWQE